MPAIEHEDHEVFARVVLHDAPNELSHVGRIPYRLSDPPTASVANQGLANRRGRRVRRCSRLALRIRNDRNLLALCEALEIH